MARRQIDAQKTYRVLTLWNSYMALYFSIALFFLCMAPAGRDVATGKFSPGLYSVDAPVARGLRGWLYAFMVAFLLGMFAAVLIISRYRDRHHSTKRTGHWYFALVGAVFLFISFVNGCVLCRSVSVTTNGAMKASWAPVMILVFSLVCFVLSVSGLIAAEILVKRRQDFADAEDDVRARYDEK